MANINLLPWREERRQELKQEFLTILGGVAVIGFALVFLADSLVSGAISDQQSRNNYLKEQIKELSLQVNEIKELETKKQKARDVELEKEQMILQRFNQLPKHLKSVVQGKAKLMVDDYISTNKISRFGEYTEKFMIDGFIVEIMETEYGGVQ